MCRSTNSPNDDKFFVASILLLQSVLITSGLNFPSTFWNAAFWVKLCGQIFQNIHCAAESLSLIIFTNLWSLYQAVSGVTKKCLALLEQQKLCSIAFPVLGTGNLGYDCKDVAKGMLSAIKEHLTKTKKNNKTSIKRIKIVIHNQDQTSKKVREFIHRNSHRAKTNVECQCWNTYGTI